MSEIITASITVFSGVLIYVFGQLIIKFFVEPYKNIAQAIEGVIFVAFAYDKVIVSILDIENPKDYERLLEARREYREKGSRLIASVNSVPAYDFLQLFLNIPVKNDLLVAGQSLLAMGDLIGNAHSGDEMMSISQYKYLLVNKLGVKLASWESIDFEKINDKLRSV